jgi:hypothetical protein
MARQLIFFRPTRPHTTTWNSWTFDLGLLRVHDSPQPWSADPTSWHPATESHTRPGCNLICAAAALEGSPPMSGLSVNRIMGRTEVGSRDASARRIGCRRRRPFRVIDHDTRPSRLNSALAVTSGSGSLERAMAVCRLGSRAGSGFVGTPSNQSRSDDERGTSELGLRAHAQTLCK